MKSHHRWTGRPGALQDDNYATFSRQTLFEHYRQDNKAAAKAKVEIPPRRESQNNAKIIRVCQWNVHFFEPPHGTQRTTDAVLEELLRHDPDVIVLNEIAESRQIRYDKAVTKFIKGLVDRGYIHYQIGPTEYPTAVFSRLPTVHVDTVDLRESRHAVCLGLQLPRDECDADNVDFDDSNSQVLWIYGTHLHHVEYDKGIRYAEMHRLLQHTQTTISDWHSQPILIAGDFNQQRPQDYSSAEWDRICSGKQRRREEVSMDDGVAQLLESHGFVSSYDNPDRSNWDTSYPPATHWSGTVIDYAYGNKHLRNIGTFVSPSGLSDHRLVVTDWEFNRED